MERQKKYGTFAGVYTPSLLTILGVIMYLRLGWVVGEAGLIYTIGIILVAHIISITTGLSLSAIATDKKIKAGGIYFMLSRSLGLPMGGAIGATIFMATSLSIALYIVGFSESILAVESIKEFLMLDQNIFSIRIVGSAIMIILVIIALISTSLAIKTQYIILSFIALSLVSIFVGIFHQFDISLSNPSINMAPDAPGLDVLFAIFFPAVTGFTVGVAMSGDLKNPKKSIPRGTLWAIFTGLFVYLSLTIALALFVDREVLRENHSLLVGLAWIPLLVLAGIWGATLSSALGGVLGGPRIIQALAQDKLAPRILKKTYGINNEPRMAIILVYIIAQTGILIGDLNTIARVVTMFFIAAYGFINLAFVLESWASSDFRPSFKVPKWVGVLGFISSFFVMMQIDLGAMVIAVILIWLTYFIMRKRQQKLDLGDVWQSVWASVVRQSLFNMDRKGIEDRNWRPNIILFSGNSEARPHLLDFGKALIGNHGFLTSFDIREPNKWSKIQPKSKKTLPKNNDLLHNKGIFYREYYHQDVYESIETLSQTYGFAGVEPNTVIMGWARKSTNPLRYAQLIQNLIHQDLNVLLLDYDAKTGFGKKKTIDIWWKGSGNNGNLAINLVKFLWLSDEWRNSKTRLMIENPLASEYDNIYQYAREVLENLRVDAQIVIINNEVEKKPFYDIIRVESTYTDIIFLGIPEIAKDKEQEFVEKTHSLCADLGTVVLLKASTQFKRLNIGIKNKPYLGIQTMPQLKSMAATKAFQYNEISWPKDPTLKKYASDIFKLIEELQLSFHERSYGKIAQQQLELVQDAEEKINTTYQIIEKRFQESISQKNTENLSLAIYKLTNNSFTRYLQVLLQYNDDILPEQKKNLTVFFGSHHKDIEEFYKKIPQSVFCKLYPADLQIKKDDSFGIKWLKIRKRFKRRNTQIKINTKSLLKSFFPSLWYHSQKKLNSNFNQQSSQFILELQKAFNQFKNSLQIIESTANANELTLEIIQAEKLKLSEIFDVLKKFIKTSDTSLIKIPLEDLQNWFQDFSDQLNQKHPTYHQKKFNNHKTTIKHTKPFSADFTELWLQNQRMQINQARLQITLLATDYKIYYILRQLSSELLKITHPQKPYSNVALLQQLKQRLIQCQEKPDTYKRISESVLQLKTNPHTLFKRRIKELEDFSQEKINSAISNTPSQIELHKGKVYLSSSSVGSEEFNTYKIEAAKLLHFICQNELISPLQIKLSEFSKEIAMFEESLKELLRLIKFSLTIDEENPEDLPDADFFKDQHKRVLDLELKLQNARQNALDKIDYISNRLSHEFSLAVFLKTAETLKLTAPKKEKDLKPFIVKKWFRTAEAFSNQQFLKIWYGQSKRLVFAGEKKSKLDEPHALLNSLHDIIDKVSPRADALKKIPQYYQQLFLRKNNYFMDFWHGKEEALTEAHKAMLRHQKGHSGALLIKGEHNSGKSFFINYFAHKFLQNRPIYTISPPFAGSIMIEEFILALSNALDNKGTAEYIFERLPEKSVLIFEDAELWWERTENGIQLIQYIFSLVEKYGNTFFFVFSMNKHSYHCINSLHKISAFFLAEIHCAPFNAEEIKNIIMLRHKSGNHRFMLNNTPEEEMNSWDIARFFNNHFSYSDGNIGVCLQSWITHINDFKNDTLYIKTPKIVDISALNKLDPQTMVILAQFILHKRIHTEKMQRIMFMEKNEVEKKMQYLKRAGLITEPGEGVYILNPNIHAFIRKKLLEKELL